MKKLSRHFIVIVFMLFSALTTNAVKFTVNGITYETLLDGNNVQVTYEVFESPTYSGDVVIPNKVNYNGVDYSVIGISSYAFFGCSSLASIEIPSSVTTIGDSTFGGCRGLVSIEIPSSVTTIGDGAFSGCSGLASIEIPSSVTTIRDGAFSYCSSLAVVNIPSSVTTIGDSAFFGCSSLASIDIPTSVTTIGDYAFRGCSSLAVVDIPSSVTTIEDHVFEGCSSLAVVNIPSSVTSIGMYAFGYCSSLASIEIPTSVAFIWDYAFRGCSSLTTIYIPETVETLGNNCFLGTNIKTAKVAMSTFNPARLRLSSSNYDYNKFPETLIIEPSVKTIVKTTMADKYKKVFWLPNTPPSNYFNLGEVNYVGNSSYSSKILDTMMYEYNSLSSMFEVNGVIFVPKSITDRTCDIVDCNYNTANKIDIDDYVEYKGVAMDVGNVMGYAFYNNQKLESVSIKNVNQFNRYVFGQCTSLKKVSIQNTNSIGDYAFVGCSDLNGVVINNTFSIGKSVFSGCANLSDVRLSNVGSLGEYCFENCSSLQSIDIPQSITEITPGCFYGCSALTGISIPKSVMSIGGDAFSGCTSMGSFTVQDRTSSLSFRASLYSCPLETVYIGGPLSYNISPFYENKTLRDVYITDTETQIYDNEFYGCSSLKNVYIGDGVTSIGKYAFSGCSSLESFKCGSSLQSIGDEAFSDCTAMTNLYSRALTPPTCGCQALEDINKWECTLHVLPEASGAYKSADQWKDFFFVDGEWSSIDSVIADYGGDMSINGKTVQFQEPRNVAVYSTDGRVAYRGETDAISLEPGLYLIVVDGKQRHKIVIR